MSVDVLIRGAGIAGLTAALALARRGAKVTLAEQQDRLDGNASWYAGGMLAPFCEGETADERVQRRGIDAIDWWDRTLPGLVQRKGTLVVAAARDQGELTRFARQTDGHQTVDAAALADLEPDLAHGFQQGLFMEGEAHMDARQALLGLLDKAGDAGVETRLGGPDLSGEGFDFEIDATGLNSTLPGLRAVRGEMAVLHAPGVRLTRVVRFLHPRIPVYIVPRDNRHFMVGATMIESDRNDPITVRSLMDLLNAAYCVNPAFGEASIVETGVGLRPAFPDNLPRVVHCGSKLAINGLYRHGFLLAPALAEAAADLILNGKHDEDFVHETNCEW